MKYPELEGITDPEEKVRWQKFLDNAPNQLARDDVLRMIAGINKHITTLEGALAEMRRLYKLGHYDDAWIEQRIQSIRESGKLKPCEDGTYELELLYHLKHKTEVTLCAVMANNLGEISYMFILRDDANLNEPVAFDLVIRPNGKAELQFFNHKEDVEA